MTWLRRGLIVGLWVAVIVSALGVVYAKHQSRQLFVRLQGLKADRDVMDVEWGRLQLEQSTQATHERIESIARERLDMENPTASVLIVIER